MADTIAKAKAKLQQARDRARTVADRSRRDKQFDVDDLVLLSSRNMHMVTPGTNKLLPKYLGPFKVLGRT